MIEDDTSIIEAMQDALTAQYQLDKAISIKEAKEKLQTYHYHLILLDIHLPDGNGIDFIQELRQITNIPIIFLSVVNDEYIISRGLDLGADDYIIKPFSIKILMARINSVLRRYYGEKTSRQVIGDIEIDLNLQNVYKQGHLIPLTPLETKLFFTLAAARGKILTRRFLLEQIWDQNEQYIEDNTLTVHIRRLKQKIGQEYIQTKRNVGYYFVGETNEKK